MNFPDIADDSEDTQHTAAERSAAASRSTWVSVGVNLVLTITQIVVGVFAKSQGLIADGIHSMSDLVADFVVLFASHHSKKDADEDHPYGHQRFETAASLVLGLLLLVVGVGMLWSAFRKLEAPETVQQVHVIALWVAAGALVAKELLFRPIGRRVVVGGGHRHHWQPGGVPDSGPDCGTHRGLYGDQNGLGFWLGCHA
jgi:cation diffusion facilitator family transporter